MNDVVIYVRLIGEDVEVWRPVRAEVLADSSYRIADQPYDRDTETWEFEPGDRVACRQIESSDGLILVASMLAER